jgi:hypothetical protein
MGASSARSLPILDLVASASTASNVRSEILALVQNPLVATSDDQEPAVTYSSYLALDKVLGAQVPRSGEHDEIL